MRPVVSAAVAALPKVEQSSTLKGSNNRIVFGWCVGWPLHPSSVQKCEVEINCLEISVFRNLQQPLFNVFN